MRGGYKIVSKASGKVLDIVDMSMENGARVQIWDDVNGAMQTWKLTAVKEPKKAAVKSEPAKPAAEKAAPKKRVAKKAPVAKPVEKTVAQPVKEEPAKKAAKTAKPAAVAEKAVEPVKSAVAKKTAEPAKAPEKEPAVKRGTRSKQRK